MVLLNPPICIIGWPKTLINWRNKVSGVLKGEGMMLRQEKETDFPAIYDLVKTAFQTAKVSNGDEQNFVDQFARQRQLPSRTCSGC